MLIVRGAFINSKNTSMNHNYCFIIVLVMATGSINVQDTINFIDGLNNSFERHKLPDPSYIQNFEESFLKSIGNGKFAELDKKAITLLHTILTTITALFEKEEKNQKDIEELRKQLTNLKEELQQKQAELDMMTVCQMVFTIEDMVIDQVLPNNKALNPGYQIYRIHKMEEYLNDKETFEGTEKERQAAIRRWEELKLKIGWTKTSKIKNSFWKVKQYRIETAHDKQPPDVVKKNYRKLLSMKTSDRKFQEDKWHFEKCIAIYEELWKTK